MSPRIRSHAAALTFALATCASASSVQARPFRVSQVPNGPVAACFTCHVYPGGPRNAFGTTIETYAGVGFLVDGNVQWGTLALSDPAHPSDLPKTLAQIDSDGDGRTNGEELLDPSDTWRTGDPNPGAASLVRLPGLADPPVVIRQVYTGGGLAGATYTHDFIELYNRSTSTVSISGWSLQFASAFGGAFFGSQSSTITPLPAVNLAPGQSLLVAGASDGSSGGALPANDATDSTPIALPATGGKIVLVSNSTSLPCNGTFPDLCTSTAIVDLVGYGSADYYEGLQPAPAPSATTSLNRTNSGCTDINSNGTSLAAVTADFSLGTPTARNTSSALTTCTPPATPPAVAAPATSKSHVALLAVLLAAAGGRKLVSRSRR